MPSCPFDSEGRGSGIILVLSGLIRTSTPLVGRSGWHLRFGICCQACLEPTVTAMLTPLLERADVGWAYTFAGAILVIASPHVCSGGGIWANVGRSLKTFTVMKVGQKDISPSRSASGCFSLPIGKGRQDTTRKRKVTSGAKRSGQHMRYSARLTPVFHSRFSP